MILSNFTPIGSIFKDSTEIYLAEVNVTTKILLWRRTEVRRIFKESGSFWRFVDTGEWCPGSQCELFESAHKGKEAFALYYKDHPKNADKE